MDFCADAPSVEYAAFLLARIGAIEGVVFAGFSVRVCGVRTVIADWGDYDLAREWWKSGWIDGMQYADAYVYRQHTSVIYRSSADVKAVRAALEEAAACLEPVFATQIDRHEVYETRRAREARRELIRADPACWRHVLYG